MKSLSQHIYDSRHKINTAAITQLYEKLVVNKNYKGVDSSLTDLFKILWENFTDKYCYGYSGTRMSCSIPAIIFDICYVYFKDYTSNVSRMAHEIQQEYDDNGLTKIFDKGKYESAIYVKKMDDFSQYDITQLKKLINDLDFYTITIQEDYSQCFIAYECEDFLLFALVVMEDDMKNVRGIDSIVFLEK